MNTKDYLSKVFTRTYDLGRIPKNILADVFTVLCSTTEWHDLMTRRNRFCKMFLQFRGKVTSESVNAHKQIVKIDEKASAMILAALVECANQMDKETNARTITLNEYLTDFVKTPEQMELYEQFHMKLEMANMLADMTESLVTDAKDVLKKLDPTITLTEFDALKRVSDILLDYSTLRHRDEHPDLMDCFSKYSDEIQDILYLKCSLFVNEFRDIHKRLEAAGALKPESNQSV